MQLLKGYDQAKAMKNMSCFWVFLSQDKMQQYSSTAFQRYSKGNFFLPYFSECTGIKQILELHDHLKQELNLWPFYHKLALLTTTAQLNWPVN